MAVGGESKRYERVRDRAKGGGREGRRSGGGGNWRKETKGGRASSPLVGAVEAESATLAVVSLGPLLGLLVLCQVEDAQAQARNLVGSVLALAAALRRRAVRAGAIGRR